MKQIYRHGELLLVPCKDTKGTKRTEDDYIVAHSETGHHHMIAGMCEVFNYQGKDMFLRINRELPLIHKKNFDKHNDLKIIPGDYEIIKKTEYDPFSKAIREIWD